jgi:hypothetical protein
MRISNVAVTGAAFDSGLYVRLMRKEHRRLSFERVDARPRRLLVSLGEGRQFLHLRTLRLYGLMAQHAGSSVGYRRVSRFVRVFVAEPALESRIRFAFLAWLRHVLPVIERDRLRRRNRFTRSDQQKNTSGQQGDYK